MFSEIESTAEQNTARVLASFRTHRVSEALFAGSTGYGYGDRGRDTLDAVFADVFGAQDALVRIGFVSGTHAIACALGAALKPGETLLSCCGTPYDTLHGVIGITGGYPGSLKSRGIDYAQAELITDGRPDEDAIAIALKGNTIGAAFIQRSRGYSQRPALSCADIGGLCTLIKTLRPDVHIVVDNCYGEFVETREPNHCGADLAAGSLIKNPGGGLALTGGYVAGKRELVDAASYMLTAPGIGRECGATLGQLRSLYQGLFTAPHTVAQALKTAVFCAAMLEQAGYETSPRSIERRADIIQSVSFPSPGQLLGFVRGIQSGAPVDSFATPEPWDMPGYDCPVVMAAGAFVQGASIELSCDAPMREPYTAYLQGGLTYEAGKLGVMLGVQALLEP